MASSLSFAQADEELEELPVNVNAVNSKESDINDIFEKIAFSEDNSFKKGYHEGSERARLTQEIEGYHLGYHRGAEIGAELGFYKGVLQAALTSISASNEISDKICTLVESTLNMIDNFPETNENENIIEILTKIRSSYKKICSLLRIKCVYPFTNELEF